MTHWKNIKFTVYKTALLSLPLLLVMPFGANPALAESLYEKQVKLFNPNGHSTQGKVITFELSGSTIRNLAKDIRKNQNALAAFENKLFDNMCSPAQGTIDWAYSNNTGIKITCTERAKFSIDGKRSFLEAHCAGFCTLYGDTFKKFERNNKTYKYDCTCKKNKATDLLTGEPDDPSTPVQSESSENRSNSWKISGTTEVTAQQHEPMEVIDSTNQTEPNPTQSQSNPSSISGTVVDSTGEDLIGVTVQTFDNNGNKKATVISDNNGKFTIDIAPGVTYVKFTYIGMEDYTCYPDNCSATITMTEGANNIGAVTITGNKCKNPNTLNQLHATEARATGTDGSCVPYKCKNNYELETAGAYTSEAGTLYKEAICKPKTCTVEHSDTSSDLNRYECDTTDANCYCKVENCEDGYKVSDDKRSCIEVDVCNDTQKSAIAHFKNGYRQNNVCYVTKCDGRDYKPNEEKTACVQVGGECPTDERDKLTDQNITKTKLQDGVCIVTGCKDDYKPNDAKNGCIQAKGTCSPDVEHASAGEMKSGKCVVNECEKGYHPDKKENKCIASELSEEGSQKKIDDLKKVAADAKEKEHSLANKTLGATAMLTTGLGGQQLLSGLAEKNADQEAEADMRAYLATFACDYGRGRNIKGGETSVELPGGNDLLSQHQEYVALASDLKERKQALGLRAGIESEVILDKATTGLYDDVGVGITGGKYASVSRALLDANSADAAAWAQQKSDAASKIKTGATVAGIGAVGGLIGDIAINGTNSSVKKALNKVLHENEYEAFNQAATTINQQPAQTVTCPDGKTTRGDNLTCECSQNQFYNPNENKCEQCPNGQISDGKTGCQCDWNTQIWNGTQCTTKPTQCTPECTATDGSHLYVTQDCKCGCNDGYNYDSTTKTCTCSLTVNSENGRCETANSSNGGNNNGNNTTIITNNNNTYTISLDASAMFKIGKTELVDETTIKNALNTMYQQMDKPQKCKIYITGYTDPVGSDATNNRLSLQRAEKIKNLFNDVVKSDSNLQIEFISNGQGEKYCTCGVGKKIQGTTIDWNTKKDDQDYKVCYEKSDDNAVTGNARFAPCRRIEITTDCKATKTESNTTLNTVISGATNAVKK